MVIFNQKVAGYLMLNGFVLKGIEKSHQNPKMNVFIFNESKDLKEHIGTYDNFIASIEIAN